MLLFTEAENVPQVKRKQDSQLSTRRETQTTNEGVGQQLPLFCVSSKPYLSLFSHLFPDTEERANRRARRRHARPLQLHSGDESEAEATAGNEGLAENTAATDSPQTAVGGFCTL